MALGLYHDAECQRPATDVGAVAKTGNTTGNPRIVGA